VARDILGKQLVWRTGRGEMAARMVEVEAYIGEDDPACHAAPGPTRRNVVMYGPPGFSYVYFIYGMYHCFNIVTERKGFPAAVLVRAAEPIAGLEMMRANSPAGPDHRLLSGPGKLCRALGLTARHTGFDLTGDKLFVADDGFACGEIVITRRIGIRKGAERLFRFHLADSPAVSGRR